MISKITSYVTLEGVTQDYRGDPLPYQATYRIPVFPDSFGKWDTQCIAATNQNTVCMIPTWKEQPLMGLCKRHYDKNVAAGGSPNARFNMEPVIQEPADSPPVDQITCTENGGPEPTYVPVLLRADLLDDYLLNNAISIHADNGGIPERYIPLDSGYPCGGCPTRAKVLYLHSYNEYLCEDCHQKRFDRAAFIANSWPTTPQRG